VPGLDPSTNTSPNPIAQVPLPFQAQGERGREARHRAGSRWPWPLGPRSLGPGPGAWGLFPCFT